MNALEIIGVLMFLLAYGVLMFYLGVKAAHDDAERLRELARQLRYQNQIRSDLDDWA